MKRQKSQNSQHNTEQQSQRADTTQLQNLKRSSIQDRVVMAKADRPKEQKSPERDPYK